MLGEVTWRWLRVLERLAFGAVLLLVPMALLATCLPHGPSATHEIHREAGVDVLVQEVRYLPGGTKVAYRLRNQLGQDLHDLRLVVGFEGAKGPEPVVTVMRHLPAGGTRDGVALLPPSPGRQRPLIRLQSYQLP